MKWICVDFIDSWGSGVLGLIFYGFHRFSMILGGFVWISWNPGARGRAACGNLRGRIRRESWPYRNLAILEPPRGMDDSMIRC